MHTHKKVRALVLLSGGLDSQLAVKILQNAGVDEVVALTFETPFFNANKARIAVEKLGIKIIVQDISEEHFRIVKNPSRGYGKNMNPCIDCHGMMFRIAKEIAEKEGFDIIATGEVLGQRPFSQNKQALRSVEKIAGLEDKILRPLCAKNLAETVYEKEGLVDREKLMDFSGKSRKPQMALAKKFGLKDYPTPAGGCRLTEPGYSKKLRKLLEHNSEVTTRDVTLLKTGRLFLIGEKSFVIIGRDKEENEELKNLASKENYLINMPDFASPTALIVSKEPDNFENLFSIVAQKVRGYSREAREYGGEIGFRVSGAVEEGRSMKC